VLFDVEGAVEQGPVRDALQQRGQPAGVASSGSIPDSFCPGQRGLRKPTVRLLPRDLVCQQAVELVTDYLESALSRRDRRRFESHLRACLNCRAYLEQIRTAIQLAGAIEPQDLTPEARADLTELYRRWRSE
jgi:Putative zinc-finger